MIWTSEVIPVSQLGIPHQTFATQARGRLAWEFTITPWHALPQHRPSAMRATPAS